MRIKKLELQGFKSFKDRTVIMFDAGITGVVGPNGCGKSNIVDALLWSMGEQSAKHLRGSSMEDVIFAGSEGHPPAGFAEVSLTLENDGGPFPAKWMKYSEIMVTRRLHRSGESEYLINREPSRLRDIQEVFMDTGAGAKGFSIIEQGAIGKIITAKPEDRRVLIEEAAGITKFKVRKRESQRKLQATEQNLIRLNDIVLELKRQLDGLQRQAKKAERYREIKNQIRELDLWLASQKYIELKSVVDHETSSAEQAKLEEAEVSARLSQMQADVQELKLKVVEMEKMVQGQQTARFEAQSAIQRKESEIQRIELEIEQARKNEEMTGTLLQELEVRRDVVKIDLENVTMKLATIEKEAEEAKVSFEEEDRIFAELRKRLVNAEITIEAKRAEKNLLSQKKSGVESQIVAADTRIQEFASREEQIQSIIEELIAKKAEFEKVRNRNFSELEQERQLQLDIMNDVENFEANKQVLEKDVAAKKLQVESEKEELTQVAGKLHGLEDLDANFEGFQEGVKNVMMWQREQRADMAPFRMMADVITVPAEFEVAMEAVLGSRLQVIMAGAEKDSMEAIDYLKKNAMGRSSFWMGTSVETSMEAASMMPMSEEVDAILGQVAMVAEDAKMSVAPLLERIAVVSSMERAMELRKKYGTWTFVTREGDVVTSDGVMSGGTMEAADSGVLRRRREMRELAQERDVLGGRLTLTQRELNKLEDQLAAVRQDLENARTRKTEKEIMIAEKRKDLERSENELQNAIQAVSRQERDLADIMKQKSSQEEVLEELRGQQTEMLERIMMLEAEVEKLTAEIAADREDSERRQKTVTELQVRMASKMQEMEGLKRQHEMFDKSFHDLEAQISRMAQESSKTTQSLSVHQIQLQEEKVRLDQLITDARTIVDRLSRAQDEYEVEGARLREMEDTLGSANRRQQELYTAMNDSRLKLEQAKMKESNMLDQIMERYMVALPEVVEQYRMVEGDGTAKEAELEDLKDKARKMGEVNLSAIEEYDDLINRYNFLSQQQNDLLESQVQLKKVIERIDRICSKQFKETFDMVNSRFERIFPVLFGGGEAHLALVEHEGMDEPGIDMIVRPPGKKAQNITLLSGGEKALSSVALIFAIFLVKPSPFCLLDEVDAPLDDANVFRFNELIKEMAKRSQIIVVTHNKHTMEVNDKLYGVTMEERGVSKMVSVDLNSAQKVAEQAMAH